jgi:hypothetical protein
VRVANDPFLAASWVVTGGRFTHKDATHPIPGETPYYSASADRPPGDAVPAYYEWLAHSPFVTLYAASNPYDDFADSLATYVHTELLGRPFALRVYKDDRLVHRVGSCWKKPRCQAKRRLLEEFLDDPS